MKQPKVTILIAVYNAENYLRQCLDSLLRQTLADWQAVCVDDASTDGSWSILQEYASREDRVEVYRLPQNHGQAHARNVALAHARGATIGFLDSDDWLADDCLEQSMQVFEEHPRTDAVLLHTSYYYSADRVEEFPMDAFEVKLGQEAFLDSLTWKIHGVYIVRTDIHKRYPYDESAHAFSDDNTTRLHYLASREVRLSTGTYYYRQHSDSVSHQISVRRFDYLKANESMMQQLKDMHADENVLDTYENHRWLNIIDMYLFYYRYRRQLGNDAATKGLAAIRHARSSINCRRLSHALRWKFGYMPCRWWLFRLQEELYFTLRRLFRRL